MTPTALLDIRNFLVTNLAKFDARPRGTSRLWNNLPLLDFLHFIRTQTYLHALLDRDLLQLEMLLLSNPRVMLCYFVQTNLDTKVLYIAQPYTRMRKDSRIEMLFRWLHSN